MRKRQLKVADIYLTVPIHVRRHSACCTLKFRKHHLDVSEIYDTVPIGIALNLDGLE